MSIDEYRKALSDYRELFRGSESSGLEGVERATQDTAEARNTALSDLQDASKDAGSRITALLRLRAASFSDEDLESWLPVYKDALRSATESSDDLLRQAAYETLCNFGDNQTQEKLIQSLESGLQLIPEDLALQLLSLDPHANVSEIARKFATKGTEQSVRVEALRVLAADAAYTEGFAEILADTSDDEPVRALSATALSNLDRQRFKDVARGLVGTQESVESTSPAIDTNIAAHLRMLLEQD